MVPLGLLGLLEIVRSINIKCCFNKFLSKIASSFYCFVKLTFIVLIETSFTFAFSKSVMLADTKLVILAVWKSAKSMFGVLMSAHLGVLSVDFVYIHFYYLHFTHLYALNSFVFSELSFKIHSSFGWNWF